MKFYILIVLFFILVFTNQSQGSLKKGDPASDFSIIGQDGNIYHLSQFKSKVILIEFLSTKCFACDMVIPDINRLKEKFTADELSIVGILFNDDIGDVQKLKEFSESREIRYPLYIGDKALKKNFNIYGFPNFIILNEKKKIVQIYRGITKDMFGLLNNEIEILLKRGGK